HGAGAAQDAAAVDHVATAVVAVAAQRAGIDRGRAGVVREDAGAVVAHEGAGAGLNQPFGKEPCDFGVDDHFGRADAVVDGEGPGGQVQLDGANHAGGVAVGVRGGGHIAVQLQGAGAGGHVAAVHGQRPDYLALVVQVEAAREVDGDGGVVGYLAGVEQAHDVGVEV